ncbi:MAG: DUF2069 domain-containing protein [Ottowia sp.]|nr:DUF2069 domain-containing protein [Ottowia sp.]
MPNAPAITPALRATRAAALACLLLLAALIVAWELWLAPLRSGGSWLVLKAVPLLAPLPGLLRWRLYTFRWTCLFVWLYAAEGAVRAWGDKSPGNMLALVQVLLCIVLFAACAAHVRLRLRATQKHGEKH